MSGPSQRGSPSPLRRPCGRSNVSRMRGPSGRARFGPRRPQIPPGVRLFEHNREETVDWICGLIARARSHVLFVDLYLDADDLQQFATATQYQGVTIRGLINPRPRRHRRVDPNGERFGDLMLKKIEAFRDPAQEFGKIDIRVSRGRRLHDRFLQIDDVIWHAGHSFNMVGRGEISLMTLVAQPTELAQALAETFAEAEPFDSWWENRPPATWSLRRRPVISCAAWPNGSSARARVSREQVPMTDGLTLAAPADGAAALAATLAWIGASEGSDEPFSQGLKPLDTSGAPGSLAEHLAAADLPAWRDAIIATASPGQPLHLDPSLTWLMAHAALEVAAAATRTGLFYAVDELQMLGEISDADLAAAICARVAGQEETYPLLTRLQTRLQGLWDFASTIACGSTPNGRTGRC